MISWVVGRGLLGRPVERTLRTHGEVWRGPDALRWSEPDVLGRQLGSACKAFALAVGDGAWQVAWCAGAGVIASDDQHLDGEEQALSQSGRLSTAMGGRGHGTVFIASSAGGVYAGSAGPPFTEATEPRPFSYYGETKLRQETIARNWSAATATPVLIGRIANLYGPGQDVSKPQGLISQLAASMLRRRPITLDAAILSATTSMSMTALGRSWTRARAAPFRGDRWYSGDQDPCLGTGCHRCSGAR